MIKKLLQEAKEAVEKLWYEVYYIWLYGSQNYNLDTEKSDYDYLLIKFGIETFKRKYKNLLTFILKLI